MREILRERLISEGEMMEGDMMEEGRKEKVINGWCERRRQGEGIQMGTTTLCFPCLCCWLLGGFSRLCYSGTLLAVWPPESEA